jgi:hypothetical protein
MLISPNATIMKEKPLIRGCWLGLGILSILADVFFIAMWLKGDSPVFPLVGCAGTYAWFSFGLARKPD